MLSQPFEMEPDMPHPARHKIAPEFDLLAREDRLLAVERQAIRVFENGNGGEKSLCGDPTLD